MKQMEKENPPKFVDIEKIKTTFINNVTEKIRKKLLGEHYLNSDKLETKITPKKYKCGKFIFHKINKVTNNNIYKEKRYNIKELPRKVIENCVEDDINDDTK